MKTYHVSIDGRVITVKASRMAIAVHRAMDMFDRYKHAIGWNNGRTITITAWREEPVSKSPLDKT
jgi:hypothetical protein